VNDFFLSTPLSQSRCVTGVSTAWRQRELSPAQLTRQREYGPGIEADNIASLETN
jgi:hypothetical protein